MRLRRGLAVAGVLALAGATLVAQTIQINGAGATFPHPIYSKWFSEYNKLHPNVQINYQPNGSGGGYSPADEPHGLLRRDRRPDDSRSDDRGTGQGAAHPDGARRGGADVQHSRSQGRTEVQRGRCSQTSYLGKITKWNDPAIVKLNAGANLPATDITVGHRSDGSGTTYIWTDYLSKVSPEFRKTVGVNTSVKWPVGRRRQGQ